MNHVPEQEKPSSTMKPKLCLGDRGEGHFQHTKLAMSHLLFTLQTKKNPLAVFTDKQVLSLSPVKHVLLKSILFSLHYAGGTPVANNYDIK